MLEKPLAFRRMADIISLSRIVLVVPWAFGRIGGFPWSIAVLALIILTDLLDGPVARMTGTANPTGGRVDSACDLVVTLAGAAVLGVGDPRYAWICAIMGMNFLSWVLRGGNRGFGAYTRIGRYNGAACYALLMAAEAKPWLARISGGIASGIERASLWAVSSVLIVSSAENLLAFCRGKARSGLRRRRGIAPAGSGRVFKAFRRPPARGSRSR